LLKHDEECVLSIKDDKAILIEIKKREINHNSEIPPIFSFDKKYIALKNSTDE
jgi:hypothetical protein